MSDPAYRRPRSSKTTSPSRALLRQISKSITYAGRLLVTGRSSNPFDRSLFSVSPFLSLFSLPSSCDADLGNTDPSSITSSDLHPVVVCHIMTDNSIPLNTHTAPLLDAVNGSIDRSSYVNASSAQQVLEEDEPYTIKCICGFRDDDGNTVFCEGCETWQHIECYYHGRKVPEVHNCTDCEPRPLDFRRAYERQRRRREQVDLGDRKPKRPPAKSHKKKVKVSDQGTPLVNGWVPSDRHDAGFADDRRSGSPRDQPPPAKKSKTFHRNSSSISSQAGTPALAIDRRKRADSNPHNAQSPVKSSTKLSSPNGYYSEPYSLEFMQLYEDDPGDMPMQANLFNSIGITSSLSSWSHDRDALALAANGRTPQEVFLRLDRPIQSLGCPGIEKQIRQDRSVVFSGRHPTWQYLTVDSFVPEGQVVGELKGQIGHMHEYCQDPAHRWQALRHPVPFVFFHPHLPIYIDTRLEGTRCRYVRRSCRPNLKMKTILTDGLEYHFCFIATEPLEAGSEITIGWVLDENIRKYLDRAHFGTRGDGSVKQEGLTEAEADYISLWVGKVLADFGGCACNSPQHCTLAQFDRRSSTSSIDSAIHMPNGRSRKPKQLLNNVSPFSTGQATNSRAGSEGLKYQEDDEQDDGRSTSGSTHSKPQSRDMTPATRFSADLGPVPGSELSDREKRKIAAAERTFEQLAHDNKAHKRKKRNSGASNPNTPGLAMSVRSAKAVRSMKRDANSQRQKQIDHTATFMSQPNTPNVFAKPGHIVPSTSRGRSCSPSSHIRKLSMANESSIVRSNRRGSVPSTMSLSSQSARPNYVDSMMQTDNDEKDAWEGSSGTNVSKRKSYVSLTKRLLMRCHEDRMRLEEEKRHVGDEVAGNSDQMSDIQPINGPSPAQSSTPTTSPTAVKQHDQEDVEMKDVEGSPGSTIEKPRPPDTSPIALETPSEGSHPMIKPPPPPWPSSTSPTTNHPRPLTNGYKCLDLHVQLPPTPVFSSNTVLTPSISGTPTSTAGSSAPSPFSLGSHSYPAPFPASMPNVAQPSPVKKKLSLGDYMSRKSHKAETPSSERSQQGNSPTMSPRMLKPFTALHEEVKPHPADGSVVVENTRIQVHSDPMNIVKDAGG